MRRYLDNRAMDAVAIERLRKFEPEALEMHPDGYYLAYSGGKDSDVILDLAERAGVRFGAHHNLTTVDPPEVIYHIRTKPVEVHRPPLLYDPPYNQRRVGCVLCPMTRDIARQMETWPRLCAAWERAVKATYKPEKTEFADAEEYWRWWLDRDAPSRKTTDQPVLFEDNPELADDAEAH